MSILKKIIADKQREVAARKCLIPLKQLERSVLFKRPKNSLKIRLLNSDFGIIAEHKRRSPSKAIINQNLNVQEVAEGYEKAGACGISVLTDQKYFGGSIEDLMSARASCNLPLLRKEFIIDEYQLIEAKSVGADCILLIAAALTEKKCKELAGFAKRLGLDVLLEVHNKKEIDSHLSEAVDIVGVNNRNLHDFAISIDTSIALAQYIPDKFVKISESGITQAEHIVKLKKHGFKGFLIGTHFMSHLQPDQACAKLISEVKRLERL